LWRWDVLKGTIIKHFPFYFYFLFPQRMCTYVI